MEKGRPRPPLFRWRNPRMRAALRKLEEFIMATTPQPEIPQPTQAPQQEVPPPEVYPPQPDVDVPDPGTANPPPETN